MNWVKRLLLYGINKEDDSEPTDIPLKAEPQDISDFAPDANVSDFEKERPMFCAACGKDLMFSNRYNYDAKTGQKFVIRVDADCPVEGANYEWLNIAEHAHLYWDGKMWRINKSDNYFGSATSYNNQFTASNVQVGWTHPNLGGQWVGTKKW